MIFEPGYYYYVLSAADYALLQEAMENYLADHEDDPAYYDFSSDFVLSDDGYYVAGAGVISEEEADFLAFMQIGEYTDYKKSTESTNFF